MNIDSLQVYVGPNVHAREAVIRLKVDVKPAYADSLRCLGAEVIDRLPIPPACLAATLEMGCNDDVDPERAADQAMALLRMLAGRGFVDGPSGNPALSCEATALTAMAQVRSPVTGLVAYRRRLGDRVRKGDLVATVIDPLGEETELRAETDGRLFARHSQPYAWPGRVLGKIAGEIPLEGRKGNLLSD
jgi:predicted deacylase